MVKVLDLFSGLEGWSEGFREEGFETVTLDLDARFHPDIRADILDVTYEQLAEYGPFDIVVASPPCQAFSVARLSHHWENQEFDYPRAKTEQAEHGVAMASHTLDLIKKLSPKLWLMENPRAMMRKMEFVRLEERRTVTYCQYGKKYMKPTDLFGNFSESGYEPRPPCKNGMPCHEAAPRGSRNTGVQGLKDAAERSKVPTELALEVARFYKENLL